MTFWNIISVYYMNMKRLSPFLPFFLSSFFLVISSWMILAYMPLYMKSLSLGDSRIGLLIGVFSIASIVMVPPAGFLSDRFSPRKMVIGSAFLFLVYTGGLYFFSSYYALLFISFLGGMAQSVFNTILYSLFMKVMGAGNRGKKVAFFQVSAYLGYGLGPLAGGYLVRGSSYDILFLAALLISVILVFITFRLPDSEPIHFSLGDYRLDMRDRKVLLLLLVVFIYATHFGVEQTSFSLLLQEKLGFSEKLIGIVFFILGISMALLAPVAGHSFDRSRNVVFLLLAGIISSSLFHALTGYAEGFGQVVAVRLLHTAGDALVILSIGLLNSELFPEHRLGGNTGILQVTRTMGIFIGNLAAGLHNTFFTYDRVFIINGAIILVFILSLSGKIRRNFVLIQDRQGISH